MSILDKEEEFEVSKSTYSRRSAASMKPKSRAASTVTVASSKKPKTKEEKKAAKEAEKKKQSSKERYRYAKPQTERYKKLRTIWWVLIIIALILMLGVGLGQSWFADTGNESLFYVIIFAGWGFLIAALIVDFGPIRKERKAWDAQQYAAGPSKEERKREKAKKAQDNARKARERKAAENGETLEPQPEEQAPKSAIDKLKFWKK